MEVRHGPSSTSHSGTFAQVCERLQLSRPSVIALIKSGQLTAIKVGRHWRISSISVDRLGAP